jgi:hypothetical protein
VIEKTVKAYICDHCGKKQYAKGAMARHERHCTANPGRKCRLCERVEVATGGDKANVDLAVLVEVLKNSSLLPMDRMAKVRELTDCPACILAAIRQSGIWAEYIEATKGPDESCSFYAVRDHHLGDKFLGFDFKDEKESILKEANGIDHEERMRVQGWHL